MSKRILDFIIVTLERKNIFLSTLYRLINFGYVYHIILHHSLILSKCILLIITLV